MHPVYMQLLNGSKLIPESERRFLVAYVPVLSAMVLRGLGVKQADHARFRAQVFHRVLGTVARLGGMTDNDPEGLHVRPWGEEEALQVFPVLCAYLGDRPELQMVAGRFVSQSDKLQQPCRRCGVHGCDLHVVAESLEEPLDLDLDAAIMAALDVLRDPHHGDKSGVNDFLTEHSVSLVESGLAGCKFWSPAVCTPRCSMHTAELVLEGNMMCWIPQLPSVDVAKLKALNARVAVVDPALGDELYLLDKFKLNPSVKTAQHLHRAFCAVSIAVRGWLIPDHTCDRLVWLLCTWRQFYDLWTSPTFTEADMDLLVRLEAAFRTELPRVFAGLSPSDFAFPTLHELTHIAQDRLLYGNDQVTTTQQLEHFHIEAVKDPFQGSNKTSAGTSLALQMVRSFAESVLLRPIFLPVAAATAVHFDGNVGRGEVVLLGNVVQQRVREHYDWKQLQSHWSRLARVQGRIQEQPLTVFSQHRSKGLTVLATPFHYGHARFDIVNVADDAAPRFMLALLIFTASAPQLPVALGNSFIFGCVLSLPDPSGVCAVYKLHHVRETSEYDIVSTSCIRSVWGPHRLVLPDFLLVFGSMLCGSGSRPCKTHCGSTT